MLATWLKGKTQASPAVLVEALDYCGSSTLARKVAEKHGEDLT